MGSTTRNKEYYEKNREKLQARQKAWRDKNPDYSKDAAKVLRIARNKALDEQEIGEDILRAFLSGKTSATK